jgi:hypothetical protein
MTQSSSDLSARLAVEDAVVRLFAATDERDWPAVEASFTDPFVLDMTSLVGGDPADTTPAAVAGAWKEGFALLDHVHHQVGNFRTTLDGDRAAVKCHGVAWHYRGAHPAGFRTRTFVGTYDIDLVRDGSVWCISLFRFTLKFLDGNLELEKGP